MRFSLAFSFSLAFFFNQLPAESGPKRFIAELKLQVSIMQINGPLLTLVMKVFLK